MTFEVATAHATTIGAARLIGIRFQSNDGIHLHLLSGCHPIAFIGSSLPLSFSEENTLCESVDPFPVGDEFACTP